MKNVNLKVDPDLWQKAKVEATRRGQQLKDYIAEAVREKLDKDGLNNAKG